MSGDFCSELGLTGIDETICKSIESKPLTLNLLYKLFEIFEPQLPILMTGIENILKTNIIKIVIYSIILQQIPWLMSFCLIIIILWFSGIIPSYVAISLIIFSFIFTTFILVIYLNINLYFIEKMIKQTKTQAKLNLINFKNFSL